MIADIQELNGSILITIDGEEIEFNETDLKSIGITADIATELFKEDSLEAH